MELKLNRAAIFLVTSLCFFILVLFVKFHKNPKEQIIIYTLGDESYEKEDDKTGSGLLHIARVMKKVNLDGTPTTGGDLIVKFIKVINYNSYNVNAKIDEDDSNFWLKIVSGSIGTNEVTVEVNSYIDIDVDVEFYGYRDETPDPPEL